MTEHCPACLSAARAWGEHENGEQTVTAWRCASCRREWQTSYLTAAYASPGEDADDGPIDDLDDRPRYWDGPRPEGAPWAGW